MRNAGRGDGQGARELAAPPYRPCDDPLLTGAKGGSAAFKLTGRPDVRDGARNSSLQQ